jgi:hypothetical protein
VHCPCRKIVLVINWLINCNKNATIKIFKLVLLIRNFFYGSRSGSDFSKIFGSGSRSGANLSKVTNPTLIIYSSLIDHLLMFFINIIISSFRSWTGSGFEASQICSYFKCGSEPEGSGPELHRITASAPAVPKWCGFLGLQLHNPAIKRSVTY